MSAANTSARVPVLSNFVPSQTVLGSSPSARSQRRWGATLQRFHEEIRAWDDHLDHCRTCLDRGMWLCAEGECQARLVEASRSEVEKLAVTFSEDRPAVAANRRPAPREGRQPPIDAGRAFPTSTG